MLRYIVIIGAFPFLLWSCTNEEENNLPPVEERVNAAINSLKEDLLAPEFGWKVEYKPTNESGAFYMILDFMEDGQVNIQSDLAAEDGEYFDDTIPYRIDNALGLELIFETFGVFHFLFEQDQASFGAEFEFVLHKKDGNDLIFRSASDLSSLSTMTLTPASSGDASAFSRDIATNLDAFATVAPQVFETPSPIQQLVFNDLGISLFWSLNPAKRTVNASLAGVGTTYQEVFTNDNLRGIGQTTGYILKDGSLNLLSPIAFNLNGSNIAISSIAFDVFENNGPNLCPGEPENGPKYDGSVSGLGSVTMISSLFDFEGQGFQPQANSAYSVNIPFVIDDNGQSLSETGSIAEKFPNAVAFVFFYGFEDDEIPPYSLGFILENEDESTDLFLQEFEPAETFGNQLSLNFKDAFYHSETATSQQELDLASINSEVFEGELVYVSDLPIQEGLTIYKLFNPCNQYEVLLVQ